ncbi:hypothetical protein LSCM1_08212 [Leishmania martiniquensis]|uniref:Uncharacterized protein n=1 Tax=Leishmania martiniquensis TaxID=1580590 RepID=A0A836I573_9TRYP|nr:hypothetical protein LSCM1_08212 [Leishmania martiniquensis]
MMSKAAFMMQEQVRRKHVAITDVHSPNTFFVRGRLPFPQGLMAIAVLFKNKRPADVYAHPYFIEKQSDPSQPSPQLHLTEESQGIMKVMSGLRYMRDDNAKLDNTMVVVTDYKVEAEARMPIVPQAAATVLAGPKSAPAQDASVSGAEGRTPLTGVAFGKPSRLTLEQRSMLRRPAHHIAQSPSGGGDAGYELGGMRSPFAAASRPAAPPAASSSSSSRSPTASTSREATTASGSRPCDASSLDAASTAMPGYTGFPTPEDCATDAWASYHYLKAALFGRCALEEAEDVARRINVPALFETCAGGYTVLYNPIEVSDQTFVEVLLKLQREERVVKAIVVPTRAAWRHLQVWADIFPDAELITSGEVPALPAVAVWPPKDSGASGGTAGSAMSPSSDAAASPTSFSTAPASAAEWRGGCQDMGDGMTGIPFPEVDLEAEAALERERASEAAAKAEAMAAAATQRERTAALRPPQTSAPDQTGREVNEDDDDDEGDGAAGANGGGTAADRERQAALRRQQQKLRWRQEIRAAEAQARAAAAEAPEGAQVRVEGVSAEPPSAPSSAGDDLVDVLWRDAAFFSEKRVQAIGLREGDARRLRVLSPRAASSPAAPVDVLRLTPTIELLRIPGDSIAEEFALFDMNSKALACTDLYHGAYADLDPVNSWMCRVWFKFMKRGNYKRTDLVPRYKWLQVLQQRSLPMIQAAIDDLTRQRPIKYVISAHGTPPLGGAGAVNTLRRQWNLPPLHPAERSRAECKSEKGSREQIR